MERIVFKAENFFLFEHNPFQKVEKNILEDLPPM